MYRITCMSEVFLLLVCIHGILLIGDGCRWGINDSRSIVASVIMERQSLQKVPCNG